MVRLKRPKVINEPKMKTIRIRHVLETKWLVEVNENLTDKQKRRLQATPFRWLLDMKETIKMSPVLLRELLSRWVEGSGGFKVQNRVVPFTTIDICFTLGLRIVGEHVSLDDHGGSHVRSLFKGKDITVESILDKLRALNNDDDIEDFCRVYILLAFSVFYFPRTTPVVSGVSLNLLDDIDALNKYSWGVAVYDFLVSSLSRASVHYIQSRNSTQLHIAGCVAVLQIWAVEHLSLCSTSNTTHFPRFLNCTQIQSGKRRIIEVFKSNKIIDDLVANEEDRQHDIVIEAINEAQGGFPHWKNPASNTHDLLVEHEMLKEQNKEFNKRISILEEEVKTLKNTLLLHGIMTRQPGNGDPLYKDDGGEVRVDIPVNQQAKESLTTPVAKVPSTTKECKKPNTKLLQQLYAFCTTWSSHDDSKVFISMFDRYLTWRDLECMKPRGWLSNMVFHLAPKVMMEDEFERTGVISRYLFTSQFVENVVGELPSFHVGQQMTWTKRKISQLATMKDNNPLDFIRSCNLIFVPAIYEHHWFCYVLNQNEKKIYVLDSLSDQKNENQWSLHNAMRIRFEDLLGILYSSYDKSGSKLEIICEDLPKQRNSHDCGIYVLKYMELWDGVRKWGGKTMPDYTLGDINEFRRELLCQWILHPKNVYREDVLMDANLPQDLSMCPA